MQVVALQPTEYAVRALFYSKELPTVGQHYVLYREIIRGEFGATYVLAQTSLVLQWKVSGEHLYIWTMSGSCYQLIA